MLNLGQSKTKPIFKSSHLHHVFLFYIKICFAICFIKKTSHSISYIKNTIINTLLFFTAQQNYKNIQIVGTPKVCLVTSWNHLLFSTLVITLYTIWLLESVIHKQKLQSSELKDKLKESNKKVKNKMSCLEKSSSITTQFYQYHNFLLFTKMLTSLKT